MCSTRTRPMLHPLDWSSLGSFRPNPYIRSVTAISTWLLFKMPDYNSMKVPELKKLLNERGLTQNGNKADLIARLQDNDKEKEKVDDKPAGKFHPRVESIKI